MLARNQAKATTVARIVIGKSRLMTRTIDCRLAAIAVRAKTPSTCVVNWKQDWCATAGVRLVSLPVDIKVDLNAMYLADFICQESASAAVAALAFIFHL